MCILYKPYKHYDGGKHLLLTLGGKDENQSMWDMLSVTYSFLAVSVKELLHINASI